MEHNTYARATLTLPESSRLAAARAKLVSLLPADGLGAQTVKQHIEQDILPALSQSSRSATYYGFVTGGATPAARHADHVAVDYDQNVQVHLPNETVATDVEDCALRMLCQLLDLNERQWPHRTFTTGATASNVLGLAIGRQCILAHASQTQGSRALDVAEHGLHAVMQQANVETIQVLTTVAHSSLKKAASIVGIGRAAVIDVSLTSSPHRFDFDRLAEYLRRSQTVSIVALSYAEVNTGFFATIGDELSRVRDLCDQHGAWLHVDGAFGLLARALPNTPDYQYLADGCAGLELADSITGDAHKLINVPYDCGFFFSKQLELATQVFQNPNAAYLSTSSTADIPSPLNIGIENSRRFRALPVYATLVAYGRNGYGDMNERQVKLARAVANFVDESSGYQLLPGLSARHSLEERLRMVYMVVLFRARDDELNKSLVQRINATRKIYVSGTVWDGAPAARFAIANWQADERRDLDVIKEVLIEIERTHHTDPSASLTV